MQALVWPLLLVSSALAEPPPVRVPVDVFAGDQRGPHQTGTFEELWIDQAREETTTSKPGDKRHLMVQIWYPATFDAAASKRAPYILHRELYPHDDGAKWMDAAANVRTTSVLSAPIARGSERFPVLIYNPGGGHPPFSATFQTEFLASHGYVVVAIGHTGLTRIERFPDGYAYKMDANDPNLPEPRSEGSFDVEQFRRQIDRYAQLMMPVHVQDIAFVLDRLRELNAERGNRFYGRLNLDDVGSLGWSLGGALSLQASRDEPRIKAAMNLDGWLYTDVQKSGTHRPIMQMHGGGFPASQRAEQVAAERELSLVADSMFWQLYSKTDADWYDLTLARAEHGHFSDRTLFEPADVSLMHPRLAHDIVNRYTLEFFDKYLKRSPDTPLLSGQQAYPETNLILRPIKKN